MATSDDEAFWEITQEFFVPHDAHQLFQSPSLPPTSWEVASFADRVQSESLFFGFEDWHDDDDDDDDDRGDGGSRVPVWPPKTPPQRPGGMARELGRSDFDQGHDTAPEPPTLIA